jgi:hypothetical protein
MQRRTPDARHRRRSRPWQHRHRLRAAANRTAGFRNLYPARPARGDLYTASFTSAGGETASIASVGGENCKAFLKYGPPWQGGFLWAVRGWLCGVQGNSVQDRDLQSFVDALVVKVP